MRRVPDNQVLIVRVDGDVTDCRAVLDEVLGYGRLGNRSPLSVICSAGGYTAPIVFEDDVYGLVFSAARASESLRHVDYEVVVDFAVINNRRRGARRLHTLGYGMLLVDVKVTRVVPVL